MGDFNRKAHWENIFSSKEHDEVSWFQTKPENSLRFFSDNKIPKNAGIIDVGGGDSFLAEHLLLLDYENISVVDVSENALKRAKERIGEKASEISWIVSDITQFSSRKSFDVWHDRAVFHFLTGEDERLNYLEALMNYTTKNALFFIGTFSKSGPQKCSGIPITQYDVADLVAFFGGHFDLLDSYQENHLTPFDTTQHFTFCTFQKK